MILLKIWNRHLLVFSDKKAYNFLVEKIVPGPDGAAAHPARIFVKRGISMYSFEDLVRITAQLRSEHGCPWDRKQTHESLKPCLKEESEEVFAAIDNHDMENLCEELGDVLFQVLMHSRIAEENGAFTMDDVINGLCEKMVRRHPHVFGDAKAATPEESLELWNEIKRQEKLGKK